VKRTQETCVKTAALDVPVAAISRGRRQEADLHIATSLPVWIITLLEASKPL
jgi:hypothetical protein